MGTKKELMAGFQRNPDRYWRVKLFDELGFKRKQCVKCGKFFWTLTEQQICNDSTCRPYDFIGKPPTKKPLDHFETWRLIEDFFVRNGHTALKPYPVVCRWFPIYFTVAGIVDFYRLSDGELDFEFPANPTITPQVCLRFNDIVNTGVNSRSYTCFGMVQQSALYDGKEGYWKDECIDLDYKLLTTVFGIKPEEIVFVEDAWLGPSAFGSSLEYDVQGLELGNAVFTEFVGTLDAYREMERKVIDMGAGWERFTWLTQGTPTSYDCVFGPVTEKLKRETGVKYDEDFFPRYARLAGVLNFDEVTNINAVRAGVAKRLGLSVDELCGKVEKVEALYSIADHARALVFAISDAGLPSNVGGGYNLRVIARRALSFIDRFHWDVRLQDVALWHINYLKKMFPELAEHEDEVVTILEVEERRYRQARERARRIVENLRKTRKPLAVDDLVRYYDSDGITPEQLTDAGLNVTVPPDFYIKVTERHMRQKQVEEEEIKFNVKGLPETILLFYEKPGLLEFNAKVLKVFNGRNAVLDRTCFYPKAGGQVSDKGFIDGIEVLEALKIGNVVVHNLAEDIQEGRTVRGVVDEERRRVLTKHHTATHIVNYAARKLLGSWVWQHGAEKDVDKARLDITHFESLSDAQVEAIETLANKVIGENLPVSVEALPRSKAEEKYGFGIYQGGAPPEKTLRIVSIADIDHEACGGTHCASTGEVGFIKILKVERIQDGVERIEFAAGDTALTHIQDRERLLRTVVKTLNAPVDRLPQTLEALVDELKKVRKEVEQLQDKVVKLQAESLLSKAGLVKGLKVLVEEADEDVESIVRTVNTLVNTQESLVTVFFLPRFGRVVAMAGAYAVKKGVNAGKLAAEAAAKAGGTGGGTPRLGQGGGLVKERIQDAQKYINWLIAEQLEQAGSSSP